MSNLSTLLDRYKALVVFDTETSGLDFDNDQIIELAALRVERTATGGIRIAGKMDTFIKLPEGETLPENIVSLTGITDKRLQTEGVQPAKAASQIAKLTPTECERLQTLPDGYTSAVSATQRYRGLGNGWTAEVIIHILTGALKDVPRDEEIVVLSMYDGIGTGRYCLDKMGFTNVTYYAYEIDKPAMTVALSNYPDIIQLGDAFDLRRDDWELGKRFERTAEQKAEAPESPDQTTDLSDAPEEIKEQIIENDRALKEKDSTAPVPPPEGFDVVDQLSELLAERKKLHIIDEENLRYNCDIIALEYAIGALRR